MAVRDLFEFPVEAGLGAFELADLPRGMADEVPQVQVERFRKTLKTL